MAVHQVVSEIAGTVWEIRVGPGDKVEAGDEILVLESMKMEIPVLAETSGTVQALLVEQGASVSEGQAVASIAG